jgi:hypothetical protein
MLLEAEELEKLRLHVFPTNRFRYHKINVKQFADPTIEYTYKSRILYGGVTGSIVGIDMLDGTVIIFLTFLKFSGRYLPNSKKRGRLHFDVLTHFSKFILRSCFSFW